MNHRPLDLDVAIYRDRVQVINRATKTFADQRAYRSFSSDQSVVAEPARFEDTIVRAIRQIAHGDKALMLCDPVAHVVGCETPLNHLERGIVQTALHQAGIRTVVFEIE